MESPDSLLIDALGGATELAKRLGYVLDSGGTQRVHNWKKRGIPARVKLEHPEIFLQAPPALASVQPEAGNAG